jgi:hypothetical protein
MEGSGMEAVKTTKIIQLMKPDKKQKKKPTVHQILRQAYAQK